MSTSIIGANLSNGVHWTPPNSIFYSAANSGILFNIDTRQTTLLHGLSHAISATAANGHGLIAFGDSESVIIADSRSGRTLSKISAPQGVSALAFRGLADSTSERLVLVSNAVALNPKEAENSRVLEQIVEVFPVPTGPVLFSQSALTETPYTHVVWRPQENLGLLEFTLTSSSRVTVFRRPSKTRGVLTAGGSLLEHSTLPLIPSDFKLKHHPTYTVSAYLGTTGALVTGSAAGQVVLWAHEVSDFADGVTDEGRRAVKVVKLLDDGISVVVAAGPSHLVIASTRGCVRKYDEKFRLVEWRDTLGHDTGITSVSTVVSERFDASSSYVYSTTGGELGMFTWGGDESLLLRVPDSEVTCIACQGDMGLIGTKTGIYGVDGHSVVFNLPSHGLVVTAVAVTEAVSTFAVGYSNGTVKVFAKDPSDQGDQPAQGYKELITFRGTRDSVSSVVFSPKGESLLVGHTLDVCLYDNTSSGWVFAGKVKPHYEQIIGLGFVSGRRAVSVGKDRRVCQLSIQSSTTSPRNSVKGLLRSGNLVVLSETTVSDSQSQPTCVLGLSRRKEFIVADDRGRVRFFAAPSGGVKMGCVKTWALGERVDEIILVPDAAELTVAVLSKGKGWGVVELDKSTTVDLVKTEDAHVLGVLAGPSVGGSETGIKVLVGGTVLSIWEKGGSEGDRKANLSSWEDEKITNLFFLCQVRGEGGREGRVLSGQIQGADIGCILAGMGVFVSDWEVANFARECGGDHATLEHVKRFYLVAKVGVGEEKVKDKVQKMSKGEIQKMLGENVAAQEKLTQWLGLN